MKLFRLFQKATILSLCIPFSFAAQAEERINPFPEKMGEAIAFYASFDNDTTDADLSPAQNQDTGIPREGSTFVEGVYGKAFLPEGKRVPTYSRSGLSFETPGAALIWVSPRAWDRGEPEQYVFFLRMLGTRGQLMLAKSNQQGATDRLYAYAQGGGLPEGSSVTAGNTSNWVDDEWHLLAVNWGVDSIEFSVDGENSNFMNVPDLKDFGEIVHISVGNGESKIRQVAYDELMTFNRPLTQEEILEIYAQGAAQ